MRNQSGSSVSAILCIRGGVSGCLCLDMSMSRACGDGGKYFCANMTMVFNVSCMVAVWYSVNCHVVVSCFCESICVRCESGSGVCWTMKCLV